VAEVAPAAEWGLVVGKMIGRTEARVASYKGLVTDAYKNKDRELVDLFKAYEHDELKFLKRLRDEKRRWNEGW
jgi:hypothetical protein